MKGLDFSRGISIGRYTPTGSYVHGLRPSTKYLGFFCLFLPALTAGPAGLAASFILCLSIGAAAKLGPLFLLRGLKPVLPFFALTAALQFLFGWPGDASEELARLGPVVLTAFELRLVLLAIGRCLVLVALIALFTATSTESEIAHGLEDILSPLSRLGFPAHRVSLAAATAFRFVPLLAEELEDIVKAQASRGGDFGSGRGGPLRRARAYIPLFVPVTLRALDRARILALAMEARCYTGRGRSRYVLYEPQRHENLVRAFMPAAAALCLTLDLLIRFLLERG